MLPKEIKQDQLCNLGNPQQTENAGFLLLLLFLYFWLCWLFDAAHGLSLLSGREGYSLVVMCRPLIAVASLVEHVLRMCGFCGCKTRAQSLWHAGSGASAKQVCCTGVVAA